MKHFSIKVQEGPRSGRPFFSNRGDGDGEGSHRGVSVSAKGGESYSLQTAAQEGV